MTIKLISICIIHYIIYLSILYNLALIESKYCKINVKNIQTCMLDILHYYHYML